MIAQRKPARESIPSRWRQGGLTLIETIIALVVLSILLSSMMSVTSGIQNAFFQNQLVSQLTLRAQMAMDRIVRTASQALTTDLLFAALKPGTWTGWHCLRFRLVQSIDAASGEPVYDDNNRIYILGPDGGTWPSTGILIGHGPSLASIYAVGKGTDNLLGTIDDDTYTSIIVGPPAVELLIPDTFAPQNGDMLMVEVTPAPVGRLLTFTLRLNLRERNGNFLIPNDLILKERVALRQ